MKGLSTLDLETGVFTDLIAPSRVDVTYPVFSGDYVLFGSPLNGIDNIYAVHVRTRARFQVTSVRFGARLASVQGDKLLFSEYAPDGYNVAEQKLEPASWRPVEQIESAAINYHATGAHDYTPEVPSIAYEDQPYHRMRRLVNVHSWGITSPPPAMGFGVQSTDKMGPLNTTAAIVYDWNERTTGYEATASFSALYPVLDFSASRKNREVRHTDSTEKWTERAVRAGFHLPVNLSRGIYSTRLTAGGALESRRIGSGGLMPLNYWLCFQRFRQSAMRDIAPALGQTLLLAYEHTPFGGAYHGNLVSAVGTVYVPSPVRHHSIQFEVANERRHGGNYYFSSQMVFPRGYDSVVAGSLWKGSANYSMPLLYPDLAISQLAFLQRVSANFFYDYGHADSRLYRSAGAEATFDLHVLSMSGVIRVGVRYAYRFDAGNGRVEPFVNFSW